MFIFIECGEEVQIHPIIKKLHAFVFVTSSAAEPTPLRHHHRPSTHDHQSVVEGGKVV